MESKRMASKGGDVRHTGAPAWSICTGSARPPHIRFIQQMLGHAQIQSTQLYTQVSIRALQQVHARTHPAERGRKAGPPENHSLSSLAAEAAEPELDD